MFLDCGEFYFGFLKTILTNTADQLTTHLISPNPPQSQNISLLLMTPLTTSHAPISIEIIHKKYLVKNIYVYIYLVLTKSVYSNFCAFWLAPVTWNILGHSRDIHCFGTVSKWLLVSRQLQKIKFSGKWSSCTSKYQERNKIWLVGFYWSEKKISYWICNKIIRSDPPKHCQLKRKQTLTKSRLLFTKSSFSIFIQIIWQILRQLSPSGSAHSARYIPRRFESRYTGCFKSSFRCFIRLNFTDY